MNFKQARHAASNGFKVKLPGWNKSYLYYKDGRFMAHTEEGKDIIVDDMLVSEANGFITSEDFETILPGDELMSFSGALRRLKAGKAVARKGWNGKGMFIVLCSRSSVDPDNMRIPAVKKHYTDNKQELVLIADHIDMVDANGTYVTGWLASQTDLLANDWYIVE